MAIPLFLAMTGWEISKNAELPRNIAWMACHFSPYGTGLTNLPSSLPSGSMIIVNDRTPVCGHDPELIAAQLCSLVEGNRCGSVLLDFQRPDEPDTAAIAEAVVRELNCPVGVSHSYAKGLSCPVFLPPVPPHIPFTEYIAPWQERQIWLECALDGTLITVTGSGSSTAPLSCPDTLEFRHADTDLCCHYEIQLEEEQVRFRLCRRSDDLHALLTAAEGTNVTHAIGLYQELGAEF